MTSSPSPSSRAMSANVRASLCMLAAMAAFVVNDSMVKLSSAEMAVPQIMAVRGVMATALLAALAYARGAFRSPRIIFQPMVLLRTVADIGATIFYISALASLPLANATAIFQALPLTVTLGAALFLGEPVGWRRWMAIGAGFIGVLVIVRPGLEGFTAASLYVLGSVFCAAVRDLVTRRLPMAIPSLFISVATAFAVTLTGWAMVPFAEWTPLDARHVGTLAIAAVMIGTGYIFIVEAMRTGDMSVVAPFRYSILLFALVIGILIFGERPDALVLLGSAIVVASGGYTLYRERRRGQRLNVGKPTVP